jgi:hypothetical protein
MSDQDSPWKEALERYLPSFLSLYFPAVFAAIDWSRGYEWLNTELRQIVRDAELGKRLADVLVKVWKLDGTENWLLIHIEVQGWPEIDFPQRMFVYHYRIFDCYNRRVISLAVLADDRPNWRPDRFAYDLGVCRLDFQFGVVKLLDFADRESVLQASDNPFALVTRAHLAMLRTRHDPDSRFQSKVRLIRELYERGMSRDDVLQLFRVLDWMMDLPSSLERLFKQQAEQIEREMHMPYVTSVERLAKEEGLAEGQAEGRLQGQAEGRLQGQANMLILALTRHFGAPLPEELTARIRAAKDPALLEQWLDLIYNSPTLQEYQQRMKS